MNRFTKYCADQHGLKPDSAYPWLPYETSPGIILECTKHDAASCTVKQYYNIGTAVTHIARDGSIDWTDFV